MKKYLRTCRPHILLILFGLLLPGFGVNAQISVTTTSSFSNNNGSGTVVFNLRNTNSYPVLLQEFHSIIGITGTSAVEIYFNNTPVNGVPSTLISSNGWNLVASGSTTGNGNTTTTATVPLLTNLSLVLPANTTIGVAVYAAGQRYFSIPTTVTGQTNDSAGGVTIISGVGVGYATTTAPPAAPTIAMRGWVGTIRFMPAIPCSGVPFAGVSISSLSTACSSQNFILSLSGDSIRQNLRYQWLSSATGLGGSYLPMANDTNRNISKSQTATTWYRCAVSCGTSTDTSAPVMVLTPTTPLNGNYTVNPALPASTTNFQSLGALISNMNCAGITGPVTINVAPGIGTLNENISVGNIAGVSATNTISINGNGNNISSTTTPIVAFNGASRITWNNLNIIGSPQFAGFAVHIGGASSNITIKNSTINANTTSTATSNAAIVVSGSQSAALTAGNNGNNITIDSNNIIGGYYGIVFAGNPSYLQCTGNRILNNTIRDFYLYGIYLANTDTTMIFNNTITRDTRSVISTFYGIYGTTTRNTKVLNNRIQNSGTGSYTAYPIWFATSVNNTGFETEIINNVIYNINTTGLYYGIYASASTQGFKIYHNTVYDNTNASTGARRNIFFAAAPNAVDLRNNIFAIEGNGSGAKFNIYVTTTSISFSANRNVYFMGASAGTNNMGFWGAANLTLANWVSASSQDANSSAANPVFANITAGNFIPISVNIDNLGSNVGVVTDIFGSVRSTTTPDPGVAEFSGLSGDIAITGANISRSSVCYNAFDTIKITINNIIGSTINFSANPLTVVYNVSGPLTTTDSIVINTGTLAPSAQLTVWKNNINMLQPGIYTISNTFIRPNSVNNVLTNDTINNAFSINVRPIISVQPKTGIANSPTDTFVLTANSPLFPGGGAIFSEISHFKTTTGQPSGGWPSYLLADDYVELSGVPNSSIAGFTMEEWSATALTHTVTFPAGTIFSPNGTMIIATGQLGSSTPSPSNFYYHSGNTATHGSTTINGYVLKNPSGTIIDAVGYGTFTFPTISGVTSANWSGNTTAANSGIRLIGPDNNTAANWVNSSVTPQDPNTFNAGVPAITPGSMAGFNWYFLGAPIDTNARTKVGPYTTPGTYRYVAEYITSCGTFRDTVTITATQNVPVKLSAFYAVKKQNNVVLNWQTASEINNKGFLIERANDGEHFYDIGFVNGSGNTSSIKNYSTTDYNVFVKHNTIYYRLKQLDFDGSYAYSDIISVAKNDADEMALQIIPNPFADETSLSFTADEGNAIIKITDINGRLIKTSAVNTIKGLNIISFKDLQGLQHGIYFVTISSSNKTHTAKVIKQ